MPAIPEQFFQRFSKRYGSPPSGYWAVTAYTDLELLAHAVEEVGEEPHKVSDYLKQLPTFRGTYETIQVSGNGSILVPTVMKEAVLPQ
jgi:ABC-type branched-subunit amino acid transport system substrate-binding protein